MSHRPVAVAEGASSPYGQHIITGPHKTHADEPISMGGQDVGPTPYELLAAALGACTNMTLRMYATQKGWLLEHIATVVSHEKLTGDNNLKHDVFTRTITLAGNLDPEQRLRLLEIAQKCPVSRTLEANATIRDALA